MKKVRLYNGREFIEEFDLPDPYDVGDIIYHENQYYVIRWADAHGMRYAGRAGFLTISYIELKNNG